MTIDTGSLTQGQLFGFESTLTDNNFVANDNTVRLSAFDFNSGPATTPGAASGNPTLVGDASGTVASGFNLGQNRGNFNVQADLKQSFTAGDLLTFNLRLNTGTGTTPNGADRFAFYLFDNAGTRLTTFDPVSGRSQRGQFNPLFTIDFTAPSNPSIQEYAANGTSGPVTADVTPVPEPTTMALMLCGLGGLVVRRRKRLSRA